MRSPCLTCGELCAGSRCDECAEKLARVRAVSEGEPEGTPSAAERGYDWAWTKLSRRARRLQPFCSKCGRTDDLQTDHTPQAWERKERGLPIRLEDVDVLCGPCNRAAGAARGARVVRPSKRSKF